MEIFMAFVGGPNL